MTNRALVALLFVPLVIAPWAGTTAAQRPATPKYDDLVQTGFELLKRGDAPSAYVAAMKAAEMDKSRFDAYALGAMAMMAAGDVATASALIERAIARAPDSDKARLLALKTRMESEQQRRLDALNLALGDADRAQRPEERAARLREVLEISASFIRDFAGVPAQLWLVRASAALVLDYPGIGWVAAHHLKESSLAGSRDTKIANVFAHLERRGWMGSEPLPKVFSDTSQLAAGARAGDAEAATQLNLNSSHPFLPCKEAHQAVLASARQGHPRAFDSLAFMTLMPCDASTPRIMEKDQRREMRRRAEERAHWEQQGALFGSVSAMLGLGYANKYGDSHGQPTLVNHAQAIHWYRRAIEWGDDRRAALELAELLAATPDPVLRDGTEAMKLAMGSVKRMEQAGIVDYRVLEALAAAHAETGNWTQAVRTQQRAVETAREIANNGALVDPSFITQRLELYKRRQPFRLPQPRQNSTSTALTSAAASTSDATTPAKAAQPHPAAPKTPPSTASRSRPDATVAQPAPAGNRTLRVAASSLGYVNVRRAPDGSSPVVGKVSPGETLTFSTVSNGWYRVDGKGGWVAGRYVVVQ